ncbi:hypothetical protein [Ligilactobacillus aviarius]|mgnify:FL=1|uniref:hypothetical protein n=1 Tax=Ligilactobacillus aviarius TaxID=1606 RepID=UPI001957B5C3|nr:hypothetical protein [Ligilactobacillus aviarius]MBM6863242.1 hypothetical protein [Ligilactobacillus aviarius]
MNNLDLFVKVLTGLKEIDNVKKYLKEIKKVPNLDVVVDGNKIEVTNFTNQLLNKIVVLESFNLDNDMFEKYELENPCCVLFKKTLMSGQEVSAELNNNRIQEKMILDGRINAKISKVIDEIKDKSHEEQVHELASYVGISYLDALERKSPYSEAELKDRLNTKSIRQSLVGHLKKDKIVVVFGDEEKNYIKEYEITPNGRSKEISKYIFKYDYDYLDYRKQYINLIG